MSEQEAAVSTTAVVAPSKPQKKWYQKFNALFWITVIIPTACSLVYFSVWASDRYISESSFVVRSPNNQASLDGIGAFLQSAGLSRAQDDTYAVQEYMHSRTSLEVLSKTLPIREFYEQSGDMFSRFNAFGLRNSNEAFYQYYRNKVIVDFNSVSGIATLRVASFDTKDSKRLNTALLQQGENLINQLNTRARQDTIRFSKQNVEEAEKRVQAVAGDLTKFRTRNGIFDLNAQSKVQMELVSKLQDELIVIQTQLDQVKAMTPDNPQIPGLQARERSLKQEIAQQMRRISGVGDNSIAGKATEYQRIFLENELAQKQLAAALLSLESARAEADRKQLYLEVVSQPSEPDLAMEPARLYNIIATFIIGLMGYGILRLLVASVREHKN